MYFGDEVADALKTYIDTERKALIDRCQKMNVGDTDAVFLSLQVTRLSVRAIQNIVKKYAQTAAPLKKISPHKLRSTFGTNLYRATGDIYLVADVLGHRDVNTTKKHYAATEEDHRKLARASRQTSPRQKRSITVQREFFCNILIVYYYIILTIL